MLPAASSSGPWLKGSCRLKLLNWRVRLTVSLARAIRHVGATSGAVSPWRRNNRPNQLRFDLLSLQNGLADFGRYVVDSGIHHFAKVPLSQAIPTPEPPRKSRFLTTRWREFLKSLSTEQAERASALIEAEERSLLFDEEVGQFLSELSEEQHELLTACWQRPARQRQDLRYPSERARRWIVQRTISLGWTPTLFGEFDRYVNYNHSGRSSHKPERFGKKYQWIAYHELLARVADNYHYLSGYRRGTTIISRNLGDQRSRDRSESPAGALPGVRRAHRQAGNMATGGSASFQDSSGLSRLRQLPAISQAFLNDRETLPNPDRIARLTDGDGQTLDSARRPA